MFDYPRLTLNERTKDNSDNIKRFLVQDFVLVGFTFQTPLSKVKVGIFHPFQQPAILGQVLSIVICGSRTHTEVNACDQMQPQTIIREILALLTLCILELEGGAQCQI